MKSRPYRLWLVAIVLGWIVDFLFWKQEAGVNFALYSTLCLLGGFGLLLTQGLRPARNSLWLLIPFAFFAVVTFLRQEPLTIFLAYTFTLFSLGVLVNTYSGGRWFKYNAADYFSRFFRLVVSMFILPQLFVRQTHEEQDARGERRRTIPIVPILRGLLIALPIVAFFTFLLTSADAIFSQILVEHLEDFNLGEKIIRVVIILVCAYLLSGIFLYTFAQGREEKLLSEERPSIRQFLGFTESAIVLASVVFLFLVFVVIQFQYFFGGQANIGVEGFTYSEYARRGFSELITVACFSLVLILGLSTITHRKNESQRRVHVGLNAAIVVEVMIILFSAYQRLMLAIDWHGFSRLRLYPRIFMIWLAILLVTIVILEVVRRERFFALAFGLASLGFAVSLTLANVDASTVTRNLERTKNGKNLNVPHLASLSADAVPALAEGFRDPSVSTGQHEGVGAILMCYLNSDIMNADDDWRSFNFSRWRAKQILKTMEPLLDGFRYNDKQFPPRVRTPANIYYLCQEEKD
jgi:hypothetical protein